MTESAALIWMGFHSYMVFCIMVVGWACVYGRVGARRLDLRAWRPRSLLPRTAPPRLQLGESGCDGCIDEEL